MIEIKRVGEEEDLELFIDDEQMDDIETTFTTVSSRPTPLGRIYEFGVTFDNFVTAREVIDHDWSGIAPNIVWLELTDCLHKISFRPHCAIVETEQVNGCRIDNLAILGLRMYID
ncbi:MAG: hypothetical protein EOO88_41985, partial [Pedobacter sp.]